MRKNIIKITLFTLLAVALCGAALFFFIHFKPTATPPSAPAGHDEQAHKVVYVCPMNDIPGYFSETPGHCPKCGMKLVPKEIESGPATAADTARPAGLVVITPERQQLIGVKSAPVTRRTIERRLRAPAVVAYDEERQYAVTTRTDGWIEELFIRSVGRTVEKGAPLFTLYSPEIVAAQEEFLVLHRAGETAGKKLIEAARAKLVRLGMGDIDIATLEENDQALRLITVRSPFTGTVLEKNLLEGAKIMAGTTLYRIADLATVWLIADFYESDAPALKTGMSAEIAFPGLAKRVTGRVSYIYPAVDPATRTLKVRFSLARPAKVSIENRADVYLTVKKDSVPAVPLNAVIDTGLRRIVIHRQGNTFLPMEVRTGVAADDFIELIDGPAEGSEVVVNAAFLIDSESSMREIVNSSSHQHEKSVPSPGSATGSAETSPPAAPAAVDHSAHRQSR